MNYKMSYWLMRILGVGGILVMLIGGLTNQTLLGGTGMSAAQAAAAGIDAESVVCVLGGTIQTSFFYHCPHCKRDLPKRTLHKTCPYCKKPLD